MNKQRGLREKTGIPVWHFMAAMTIFALMIMALRWIWEKFNLGLSFIPLAVVVVALLMLGVHIAIILGWKMRTDKWLGLQGLLISTAGFIMVIAVFGTVQWMIFEARDMLVQSRPNIGDVALLLTRYGFPWLIVLGGMAVSFEARGKDNLTAQGTQRWRWDENGRKLLHP